MARLPNRKEIAAGLGVPLTIAGSLFGLGATRVEARDPGEDPYKKNDQTKVIDGEQRQLEDHGLTIAAATTPDNEQVPPPGGTPAGEPGANATDPAATQEGPAAVPASEPETAPILVTEPAAVEYDLATAVATFAATPNAEMYAAFNWVKENDVSTELPEYVYEVVDGVATPVKVDSPDTKFLQAADGSWTMEVGNQTFEWDVKAGWVKKSIDTGFVRIYLDTDFASGTKHENITGGNETFVYEIGFYSDHIDDGDKFIVTPEMEASVVERRGNLDNSPLTVDVQDGDETLDNTVITAFAGFYFKTGAPTDDQILEIGQKLEGLDGDEPLVAETPYGKWDLRKGVRFVYSPLAQRGLKNAAGMHEVFPEGYFDLDEENELTIYINGRGLSAFNASTFISSGFTKAYNKAGFVGGYQENGNWEYPTLYRAITPINPQNRQLELPLTVGTAAADVGGALLYSPM